jgi:hypothetical protein
MSFEVLLEHPATAPVAVEQQRSVRGRRAAVTPVSRRGVASRASFGVVEAAQHEVPVLGHPDLLVPFAGGVHHSARKHERAEVHVEAPQRAVPRDRTLEVGGHHLAGRSQRVVAHDRCPVSDAARASDSHESSCTSRFDDVVGADVPNVGATSGRGAGVPGCRDPGVGDSDVPDAPVVDPVEEGRDRVLVPVVDDDDLGHGIAVGEPAPDRGAQPLPTGTPHRHDDGHRFASHHDPRRSWSGVRSSMRRRTSASNPWEDGS